MNLMCRAGRRATRSLVSLCRDASQLYYDRIPPDLCAAMERDLGAAGIDVAGLEHAIGKEGILPWEDLASGTKRELLWRSYRQGCDLFDGKRVRAGKAVRLSTGVEERFVPRGAASRESLKPVVRRFVCRIGAGDAWRPDMTVARGLLREWLQRSPAATRAYAGRPGIHRFPGAWGVVLLEAAFRGEWPGQDAIGEVPGFLAAGRIIDESSVEGLLHLLRFPGGVEVESVLREGKVPFQSVRRESSLWSVVGDHHRRRTGVTAVERRASGEVRVLCSSAAADFLLRVHGGAWVGAECMGLFLAGEARGGVGGCLHAIEDVDACWSSPDRLLVLAGP